MNRTLAGTRLTPSAVHAIIEVGTAGELAAKELAEKLILDKSTVSRLLASLTANRQVRELRSKTDGRRKILRLSAKGKKTLQAVNRFAERQVATALERLDERTRREILAGIRKYAEALGRSRKSADVITLPEGLVVEPGYTPTLIGSIVEMHASYYSRLLNFGAAFETQVAAGLADFVARLSGPDNAIWSVRADGAVVGSVAIDGEDLGQQKAHLRWFIVGEPARSSVSQLAVRVWVSACCKRRSPFVTRGVSPKLTCGPSKVSMRRVIFMRRRVSVWQRNTQVLNGVLRYASNAS